MRVTPALEQLIVFGFGAVTFGVAFGVLFGVALGLGVLLGKGVAGTRSDINNGSDSTESFTVTILK